jgi:hypothetical protein
MKTIQEKSLVYNVLDYTSKDYLETLMDCIEKLWMDGIDSAI